MTRNNRFFRNAVLGAALLILPVASFAETKSAVQQQAEQQSLLANKIRHELVMLPWLRILTI